MGSSSKKKRNIKLTVGNTFRHYNLNVKDYLDEMSLEGCELITAENKESIIRNIRELKGRQGPLPQISPNVYALEYTELWKDDEIVDLCDYSLGVKIRTKREIPLSIINSLARTLDSEVIYIIEDMQPNLCENIQKCFEATITSVMLEMDIFDRGPLELLFKMYPLRTHLDNILLVTPNPAKVPGKYIKTDYEVPFVDPRLTFKYFKYIQTSLSIWKMNIIILTSTPVERKTLQELKLLDQGKPTGGVEL